MNAWQMFAAATCGILLLGVAALIGLIGLAQFLQEPEDGLDEDERSLRQVIR